MLTNEEKRQAVIDARVEQMEAYLEGLDYEELIGEPVLEQLAEQLIETRLDEYAQELQEMPDEELGLDADDEDEDEDEWIEDGGAR